MRLLLAFIILAVSSFAQYTSLSTDFTGETLFFTVAMHQTGKDQPAHGKLFLADREGIRPFVIRERIESEWNVFEPGSVTNHFDLVGVEISSNASRISLGGRRECRQRSTICGFNDSSDIYDGDGNPGFTTQGIVQFSPNGAWALSVGWHVKGPTTTLFAYQTATGKAFLLPSSTYPRDWRLHDIADNGLVAIATGSFRLLVFDPLANQGLLGASGASTEHVVAATTIDASGATVVWQSGNFRPAAYLQVWKVGTPATAATSLRVEGRGDFAPKISEDGSKILFLSTPSDLDDPQVFLVRPDGSQRRQLASIPEGVREAILSGDGMVAWVVSRTGRLLKVNVSSGVPQEWIGPVGTTLYESYSSSGLARLGDTVTVLASVMPGEAVEVLVSSERAEVTEVGVQQISFRIPSTASLGANVVTIRKPGGDPGWIGNQITFTILDSQSPLP